ncbi:lysoplasmalogenase family protein [Flavobacterium sp.]
MQHNYLVNLKDNKLAVTLLLAFSLISLTEIFAEFNGDKLLIWITKPLILPILIFYYLSLSKKVSAFFVAALLASWVANLLFIQNSFQYIFYGVMFFLLYRILVIYIIVNKVKMPTLIPLLLGSIPFTFLYVIVTMYTYDTLGENVYLFLIQGLFTIFLGGFSLGNYIMVSNKANTILLVSTMFMAFNQFIFLLKLYVEEVNMLQAVAMLLFVLGQFLLTQYMFYTETFSGTKQSII